MGRVWRATDDMLDRPVAVKEMRIDGLDAEDTRTRRERTLREARATARIDHPNVVRIYDVVDEGERLWIVMELVDGRSLEQVVAEDGPLDAVTAARIGLGLVSALREVHAGGVLHRDIKPGNVLVERRGRRVVLTDFGIAALQDAEALTMVGMLVGSPDYMAPERISGRPQGPPSDVWSLGATLCAALGGRSPFSRSTTLATLHAVLYEEPELPPVTGGLRDILAALLEKDPTTRPGLEELETTLRPIAHPEPAPQPDPGRSAPGTGAREATVVLPVTSQEPAAAEEQEPSAAGESEAPGAASSAPPVYEESPTPVFLDPQLVREARRRPQRQPEPEPTAEPRGEPRPGPGSQAPSEAAAEPDSGPQAALRPGPGPEPEPGPPPLRRPEPEPRSTPASASVHPPIPVPAPPSVPEREREPEPEPEPASDSASEPDPDSVQDAVPPQYTPTRTSPPALVEVAPEEPVPTPATAAPATAAHTTAPEAAPFTSSAAAPANTAPASNASTEAPTEPHSQARSEASALPASPPPAPTTTPAAPPSSSPASSSPSSLASHTTAHRPAPTPAPGSGSVPSSGTPGPAGPSAARRRRRTGLVAAGGVVVAGAVVAIAVAASGGSSHDTSGTSSSPSPSPTASRTPSGEPSSPPSTVDGTSRPPSLPAGAREEAGLYAWSPPQGWQRVAQSGSEVHYTSPDRTQEIVGNATPAKGDLLAQWQQAEGDTSKGLDYRRIRLERTTFRGAPAVAWEYTVMARSRLWHVRLLGFRSGGTSYEISTWYHPDVEAAALDVYDEVRKSFTPL